MQRDHDVVAFEEKLLPLLDDVEGDRTEDHLAKAAWVPVNNDTVRSNQGWDPDPSRRRQNICFDFASFFPREIAHESYV